MKLASLSIGQDLIEVHNSMWTGVETVFINGQEVSRQFNWFNGVHKFQVMNQSTGVNDYYRVEFNANFNSTTMVDISIFLNEECILDLGGRHFRYNGQQALPQQPVHASRNSPVDSLQLRQLETKPLYREDDLV